MYRDVSGCIGVYLRCLYNVSVLVGAEYRYGYRYIYDTHAIHHRYITDTSPIQYTIHTRYIPDTYPIHILDTVLDTVAYLVLGYIRDTPPIHSTIHRDDTVTDTYTIHTRYRPDTSPIQIPIQIEIQITIQPDTLAACGPRYRDMAGWKSEK